MSTVLVTGGNRGIGLGLVKQFLKKDIETLIATTRNASKSDELNAISDSRLKIIELDVSDDVSIKAAVEKSASILGPAGLSLLINNSGILNPYPMRGPIDRKALTQQFDVNTIGPLIVIQAFLPLLQKAASISKEARVITISSSIGSMGYDFPVSARTPSYTPYAMSKAAVNQMTKKLSIDFKDENISFFSFCPGWVLTEMGGTSAMLKVEDSTAKLLESFSKLTKKQSGSFYNQNFEIVPF